MEAKQKAISGFVLIINLSFHAITDENKAIERVACFAKRAIYKIVTRFPLANDT